MNVSGVSFGKYYPTPGVLELGIGIGLGGRPGMEKLYDDLTTNEAKELLKSGRGENIKESYKYRAAELQRQYPILKTIKKEADEFFITKRSKEETDAWVDAQCIRIGDDFLDVKLPNEKKGNPTTNKNDGISENIEPKEISTFAKVMGAIAVLGVAALAALKIIK